MRPGKLALTIYKGATLRRRFVWKVPLTDGAVPTPLDLTDWQAKVTVRVDGAPVITLTETQGMTLGGVDGSIEFLVNADDVEALPAGAGAWSLEMQPPGDADRVLLLQGPAQVVARVAA